MMAEIHITIITRRRSHMCQPQKLNSHLENPAIAAQADPVHRVVRVGDCKHLEEEEVGVVDVVEVEE